MKKYVLIFWTLGMLGVAVRAAGPDPEAERLSTAGLKAMKHFHRFYPELKGETWSKSGNGWMAYHEQEGIVQRSLYGKNCDWLYTIRYYGESTMNPALRGRVKCIYYDDRITGIEELHTPQVETVWLVHLEGVHSLRILRVTEEDMDIIQDLIKSN